MLTCYAEKRACYSLISYKTKKTQSCTDRSGTKIRTVRVRQDSCIYISVLTSFWLSARRCTTSGGCRFCTDRSRAETSNVRVRQDSFIYKRYPFRIPFVYKKSARRDSNPRPRPWQGRAPPTEPLAHKKCYSQAHGYYTIWKRICQQKKDKKSKKFQIVYAIDTIGILRAVHTDRSLMWKNRADHLRQCIISNQLYYMEGNLLK